MDSYVVIGNPIGHSRSPQIHQSFAQATAQIMSYERLLAPLDAFEQSVRNFMQQGGKGANITVPFKEQAFAMADVLTPRAQRAGAVNTFKFEDNGCILGDNTDGAGLVLDLKRLSVQLSGQRILLLGAGGAARGALAPLLAEQPTQLVIANRTLTKAQQLAALFADLGEVQACSFDQLQQPFDLIINATSASLSGELPALSPACITTQHTQCYDMMYGAEITAFNQWALAQGAAQVMDGLGMLVAQAAEAFQLWRGVLPNNLNEVLTSLRKTLTH
ncbi:shikimate dehydrogenase [Pseudomonas sp. F1_0610]|uniref:shikimate dehydrogenase n=1 Tax=Pseudomonas sp. F1_0610 TaxID=3114284 RepID=UPI0039C087A5